jgi:hypothetical protein
MSRQPATPGAGAAHIEHVMVRGAEAAAALYALDHAARGTPIGAEGDFAAQAARTGGNFVIAAVLWHFVIAPYLVVTAVLFAIPTIAVAAIGSSGHWTGAAWLIVAGMALLSVWLWFRYAIRRWLWRRLIRPVDAKLTGRRLDDPARRPAASFRASPARYLAEYGQLSRQTRDDYLPNHPTRTREEQSR